MTAIVGVFCSNGVIIGTDSSSTFVHDQQLKTIEQPYNKICIIDDRVIIAGTGSIGLGQRFCAIAELAWKEKQFQKPALEVAKLLSHLFIKDLKSTFLESSNYGALVAFTAEGKPHLCEFEVRNFQPEMKTKDLWYCSMGSTQPITDPFLGLMREIYWEDKPPDLYEGVFATTWALDHAIKLNPGGVKGPIRIAILASIKGQFKAREIEEDELQEHRQHIEEVKDQLREFRKIHKEGPEDIPDVPKPEK